MPDPLQPYRRKRNFAVTTEPQGGQGGGETLVFVVQKHAASHLHYDFRLELGGTLLSWAVPKGPSLDPHDKRMAVHVEDHPLDYANFEGVIPPGQYGAGTVIVWDRGTWLPTGDPHEGCKAGKLKFELRGDKLGGHWTLVRMRGKGSERQEPWLLIKEQDAAARPAAEFNVVEALPDSVLSGKAAAKATKTAKASQAPAAKRKAKPRAVASPAGKKAALPLTLAPQLATLVDAVPREGDWIYEIKFDGYRLLARVDGPAVRLFTRNGHDWTAKLKSLARAIGGLGLRSGWLDGEIVVQGAASQGGLPDFQALQNAFDRSRTDDIVYYLFDLPYCDGRDLRALPLRARRELLRQALDAAPKPSPRLRFSEDFAVSGGDLLHTACQLRMEGLIGKRAEAPYASGRSTAWIKLKCTQRQEFVVAGYTDPQGSRVGLGSLLLGVHDTAGKLRYAGNVGSGFSQQSLAALQRKLQTLASKTRLFDAADGLPAGKAVHWVKPKLVAEVSFAAWTREGRVRHAVFHGLRSDKPPRAITQDIAQEIPQQRAVAPRPAPPGKPRHAAQPARLAGFKITHPERVIDASTGLTKLALAEYYAGAARHLLPHLVRRPVALVRGPDGVEGELFFQKHAGQLKLPGLQLLDPAIDPGHDPLMEIHSREALLGAVQMNVIELHTWNATTRAIDQPDRMTFDLDPGEGLAWPQMREAAQLVHALLDELGLKSLLKTSGGKGLHIVVPFKPSLGWAAVKSLSQAIVQHLAETIPQRFVAKSGPRNRVGKIFVDYLRNGRGATTAAAWSARARPGMGVSVPVAWEELPDLKGGAHWTLRNIGERLAIGNEPWRQDTAAARRQTLRAAMRALDFHPAG